MKILAILVLLFSSIGQARSSDLEKKYLESRDQYIHKFEKLKVTADKEDQAGLKKLEADLQDIIGPIHVEGLSGSGTINIQTLQKEPGVDMLDGLKFKFENESLVVTNRALLIAYVDHHKKLPKDLSALSKDESFYSDAFDWNSRFIQFAEVPVDAPKESLAQVFLVVNSQDTGPFIPSVLTIFVTVKDRFFIFKADIKDEVQQIAECKAAWDELEKKSTSALDTYETSKSKKAWQEHLNFEKQAFNAFKQCYEKNMKNQKEFNRVKTRAQSALDRILKN